MKSSASGYQSVWTTIVLGQTPARETAEDDAAPAVLDEDTVDDAPELQAAARAASATAPMRAALSFGSATGACSFCVREVRAQFVSRSRADSCQPPTTRWAMSPTRAKVSTPNSEATMTAA